MAFLEELLDDPMIVAALRREAMGPPEAVPPGRDMYGKVQSDEPSPSPPPATAPGAGIYADAPAPGPAAPPPQLSTIAGMQPSQSMIDPTVAGMRQFTPPETPETGDYTLLVGDDPRNRPGGFDGRIMEDPRGPGGFKGFLKRGLPRILNAAIAAGATPSQFGGGPLDIFRGMQAGRAENDRRDMQAYGMQRQRGLDELNRRKEEAQMADWNSQAKMRDAQTKYYEAQANAKSSVDSKEYFFSKMISETDPKKREEYHQRWLEALGHAPKPEPNEIRTRFGIYDRAKGDYITLDQNVIQADRIEQLARTKGPQWTPALVVKFMTPEERQFVLTGTMKQEKQPGNMNPTELYVAAAQETDPHGPMHAAVNLMQRPQLTAQDMHDQRARVARLSKAQVDYQTALGNAEKVFAAGMAKINAPGQYPGSRDAKGNASKVSLADYEKEKAALLDNLVKAKNAAHEASQAVQVENDPEHFQARPGYGPDAMPLPVPGQIKSPTAKSYLDSKFPVQQ